MRQWTQSKTQHQENTHKLLKPWIHFTKLTAVLAGLTAVILFLLGAAAIRADGSAPPGEIFGGVCGIFIVSLLAFLKIPKNFKKTGIIISSVLILLIPAVSFYALQYFTLDPFRIYPSMIGVNLFFSYGIFLLLSAVFGEFRLGYAAAAVLFALLGTVNYFVVQFRSSPIVPWDFFSIRTAASVAGNYTYVIHRRFFWSLFLLTAALMLAGRITLKIRKIAVRAVLSVLFAAVLITGGVTLQKKSVQDKLGMDTILFTPNVRYRNNGFFGAFIGDLHLISVEKPEGYSTREVDRIISKTEENAAARKEETENTSAALSGKMPTIIVVINEAFSDLSVLGEFGTDRDAMPYIRSLMEEYPSGYAMVSVKGGNTANSEYEFLSGDTMAFLPQGSVVYQQFYHDSAPTLANQLVSLGYRATAIHPYNASGWERPRVYDLMDFEEFLSLKNFHNPLYIRSYISDKSAYEKIIETYESKKGDAPQLIYMVTMQNHGGYSKESDNLDLKVHFTNVKKTNLQTTAAERYLTLVSLSDEYFHVLTDYFEDCGEPVIIVHFGDHQPSDYITNVIARQTGFDADASLEEEQRLYKVPYLIWSNFDLSMESCPLTSLNFLAADVVKAAGLPLTGYQEFLLQLQKEYPVICLGAVMDKGGTYYYPDELSEEDGILNEYRILQYNHLTDVKNRRTGFFSVPKGTEQ